MAFFCIHTAGTVHPARQDLLRMSGRGRKLKRNDIALSLSPFLSHLKEVHPFKFVERSFWTFGELTRDLEYPQEQW